MNVNTLFSNYELTKLIIPYSTLQNLIILLLLIIIAGCTRKKEFSSFLDIKQTEQLKGIAILLVVVGHLWVHVSSNRAVPVLGDYAVSLFLILSGFGLSISQTKEKIKADFILRRFRRVVIPYWIVTLVIIVTDFLLLNKAYSITDVITTLAGINFSTSVKQIDYTRWFITLLLLYYLMFFIFYRFFNKAHALIGIFSFSVILCVLNITKIIQICSVESIIAFPIGCLIAFYYEPILQIFNKRRVELFVGLLLLLTCPVYLLENQNTELIVKIALYGIKMANSFLFCILLILIIGRIGKFYYVSRFLSFCGLISFEIFLIHGPLLIKYNPILKLFPPDFILVSFILLLSLVLILSYCINKALRPLVQKTV